MKLLHFDDLVYADPNDLRALLMTHWAASSPSSRDRVLHWIAVAALSSTESLRDVIRLALGEEDWQVVARMREEMVPCALLDIQVAQCWLVWEAQRWHVAGRLRFDEAAVRIGRERWAQHYARNLRKECPGSPSEADVLAQLGHLDDENRELVMRFFRELRNDYSA